MNAAVMLICMAGGATAAQGEKPIFQAPKIQVKEHSAFDFGKNDQRYRNLIYNGINIGMNFVAPKNREDRGNLEADFSRLATTYFHREGPLGVVMEKYHWFWNGKPNTYHADVRLPTSLLAAVGLDSCGHLGQLVILWSEPPIAVVEIDTGTMASYARPGQTLHYFEPVPTIVKLSLPDEGKQPLFHYIPDALARGTNLKVFEGEPRATIEKNAGAGFYQVIVVNTYKLPVVTVHKELMTKEGMAMLMGKTREDGILCYHTSSRYYDLVSIVSSVAKELKYECLVGHDLNDDYMRGHFTSEWVMVARDKKHLAHLKAPPGYAEALKAKMRPAESFWYAPPRTDKKFVWIDKGENSFRGVYRADPAILEAGNALRDFEQWIVAHVGFGGPIDRVARPVHSVLTAWSYARADAMNREPPAAPKDKKESKNEEK